MIISENNEIAFKKILSGYLNFYFKYQPSAMLSLFVTQVPLQTVYHFIL